MMRTKHRFYARSHVATFAGLAALSLCVQAQIVPANSHSYSRVSSFEYDAAGFLNAEIVEPDRPDLCVRTTYSFDSYGNKTQVTTQNCTGASTDATFAARSNSATFGANVAHTVNGQFPTAARNGLNHAETRQHDARFGAVTQVTGPNGLTTTVQYDAFGRKTLETRADGTRTVWSYAYCNRLNFTPPAGAAVDTCPSNVLVYFVSETPQNTSGVQMGPIKRTYYDSLNRAVRTETQGFDGSWIVARVAFDNFGNPVEEEDPRFQSGTPVVTRKTYDALSRITRVEDPDPAARNGIAVTEFQYTQLIVTTRNFARDTTQTPGVVLITQETRNSQGQVVRVTDALGSKLVHHYDAFGNRIRTIDHFGNQTSAIFDFRGFRRESTDPNMGRWTYAYNALGEVKRQTDARNLVTTMDYDALGRVRWRQTPEYRTDWFYDQYANAAACNRGLGKLCEVVTSHGVTDRYVYDNLGRLQSETQSVSSGPSFTSAFTYDAATGRTASVQYPTGFRVNREYNALGYLVRVRDASSSAELWRAERYNARGQLEQHWVGNNVTTVQGYNATTGRLEAIQAQLSGQAAGSSVNLAVAWDAVGNVTSRVDRLGNAGAANPVVTETFSYDLLNRMTAHQVSGSGISGGARSVAITYNAIGNILTKSDVSGNYVYNASGPGSVRPHAVAGVGSRTYSYDANGNVTSTNGGLWRTVSYTSFNLPNEDAVSGGLGGTNGLRYAWRYGPDHERIREERRSSAGTRTTWYFHPDNKGGLFFEQETSETGVITNRHYIAGGAGVFAVFASTGQGSAAITRRDYWHVDHLGSIVAVTDHTGAVTQRFSYDPFGKRRFTSGRSDSNNELFIDWTRFANRDAGGALFTTLLGSERGFTGHEHLDDVGVIHMNGRIFDPLIGRFMQADPFVQFPDALAAYNRYSYVLNNPLNATDPSGYFLKKLLKNKNFRLLLSIAISAYIGVGGWEFLHGAGGAGGVGGFTGSLAGNAAAAGFVSGAINSGTLEGAVTGAFTSLAFFGAGQAASALGGALGDGALAASFLSEQGLARALVHAAAGCAVSSSQGGDCGQGALSAGLTKFGGSHLPMADSGSFGGVLQNTMMQGALGGTISELTGGKFANGATSASFQFLFNHYTQLLAARMGEDARAGKVPGSQATATGQAALQGSAHTLIFGLSYSEAGTFDTNLQRCSVQQACLRLGPGFYLGAGGQYSVGLRPDSTLLKAGDIGFSVGLGADIGTGSWGAGGQLTYGVNDKSLTGARGWFGVGAGGSAGVDICASRIRGCGGPRP
jgi:RHS repeat-associated protein